jgi:integrase
MENEIKVKVIEFADRTHYLLQYRDPITRRKKSKSSGVVRDGSKRARSEADRAAGLWEKELQSGTYRPRSRMLWEDFRERYETEVLPSMAEKTRAMLGTVFNLIETILNPAMLTDLTAARLSHYQAELRTDKRTGKRLRSEATIRSYLAHLASALRWAHDMGMLPVLPAIKRPQRAKTSKVMKGRPITLEEFERMLAKVASVVGDRAAPSWEFYLRGLWASGLRLSESLELFWDRTDKLCIDMTERRPMLRIPAGLEKGNQDRVLPMAPEFAELLSEVPEADRHGRVFKLVGANGNTRAMAPEWVGRPTCRIGYAAGVKVSATKFASAHDLRRSFGERWAPRVMPTVLMELMRHDSIETTLKYYVGRNAATTADVLWAAHEASGNSFGNSGPKRSEREKVKPK